VDLIYLHRLGILMYPFLSSHLRGVRPNQEHLFAKIPSLSLPT
jgi:hypothetical protein